MVLTSATWGYLDPESIKPIPPTFLVLGPNDL